ncbi:MAG: ABC transporter ATP-binding protein [Eubacteriales bacterium]|nr:ABC transporter ATP-binding protein [Eubacteriales bacterium]
MTKMIEAQHVSYVYQTKYQKTQALKDVTCSFEAGKMYAIMGKSGSGKSTFLSLLAGLDIPEKGNLYIEGREMRTIDRDRYRMEQAAIVYQAFHLFPLLTVKENVMLPMQLKHMDAKQTKERAKEFLAKVGISEEMGSRYPGMLSGGEQQRVAIARAMACGGKILLADEPTGNLDSHNEEVIVKLLKKMAHEDGYAVIVVTHNENVSKESDVVFWMSDGVLSGEESR